MWLSGAPVTRGALEKPVVFADTEGSSSVAKLRFRCRPRHVTIHAPCKLWSQLRPGYLDTVSFTLKQGLAATENTELHDAKIFAVATLLSSHFLFNTIRNIDTHALEVRVDGQVEGWV